MRTLFIAMLGWLLVSASTAGAADWPERPIRIVTAAGPGSSLDILTRSLAKRLNADLGQTVVVENRPGANQLLAAEACANAKPDGYTFCTTATEPYTSNLFLFKKLPYDAVNGFSPVAMLAVQQGGIVVRSEVGARTLDEVVAASHAKPNTLNWGSYGTGSNSHLYLEAVREEKHWDVTHVPYKSVADLTQALVGGDVQLAYVVLDAPIRKMLDGGVLNLLAYGADARSPRYPNVPTFDEVGLGPYRIRGWYGLLAPAGVPTEIIERMNRLAQTAMKSPEFQPLLQNLSVGPVADHVPADMEASIRSNRVVVKNALARAKVKAQ